MQHKVTKLIIVQIDIFIHWKGQHISFVHTLPWLLEMLSIYLRQIDSKILTNIYRCGPQSRATAALREQFCYSDKNCALMANIIIYLTKLKFGNYD